ncbi:CvpA family protein [Iodobacter fluviatilis]|uniref:Membrane protein required for colicin V production n=1 Tax=Iodobacter fluviatilis TaxID=537 RepID=A0A377Q846_9NEIS|nr:CvpA family protein [Iodobacter fluviatilis]TCU88845.1 membrane protein required for colicin V production [Iodobacter fluviatilis]STQ91083.1 Pur regulon 18 kDa protein [Iodobacter fluviatilis]
MTGFDYTILGIMGLSMLLSVMRGLVQEALALAAWVLAFWLASHYSSQVSVWMPKNLPNEELRYLAAFVAIFFVTWVASAMLRVTLNQFMQATGLKPADRLFGAGFGLVRGFLLSLTLVLLAGFTSLPKQTIWRNAMFSPLFEEAAVMAKIWLPEALAARIHYD